MSGKIAMKKKKAGFFMVLVMTMTGVAGCAQSSSDQEVKQTTVMEDGGEKTAELRKEEKSVSVKEGSGSSGFQSIAEKTQADPAPEGLEVVTDRALFAGARELQDFQFQTDQQSYLSNYQRLAESEDAYYYIKSGHYLYVFDKAAKTERVLCDKPDCRHELNEKGETECAGILTDVEGLVYYQNSLYTAKREYDEKNNVDNLNLYRISLDGNTREKICELAQAYHSGNFADEGFSLRMVQHRGYIYYFYNYGTGGSNGEYYYNNGSNVLYRIAIQTGAEKEVITAIQQGGDGNLLHIKAAGSYVYFIQPDINGMGELYRLNTESLKLEAIGTGEIAGEDYIVVDGEVIYKKIWDGQEFYKINPDTGEEELFLNMPMMEEYQCLYPEYDGEHILIHYLTQDQKIRRMVFLTPQGENAGQLQTRDEGDTSVLYDSPMGGGTDYYFFGIDSVTNYMDKGEIQNASARIKNIK